MTENFIYVVTMATMAVMIRMWIIRMMSMRMMMKILHIRVRMTMRILHINVRMRMRLLHIRMSGEESPLSEFLLLWIQNTLYSDRDGHNHHNAKDDGDDLVFCHDGSKLLDGCSK